eukprot:TRINITY_DN4054_c1_g1_i4.p2 TRINITY_DN4054_c1_g1~~TRINITY_DN4054_c1_g1_i4.p2  ORF type:complete len:111 (-),score=22.85 TRINITY_DN4054_c1_g1_i4:644-976(-)
MGSQLDIGLDMDGSTDLIFKEVVQQISKKYQLEQVQKKMQELSEERKQVQIAVGKLTQNPESYVWVKSAGDNFNKATGDSVINYLNKKIKLVSEQLTDLQQVEYEGVEQE